MDQKDDIPDNILIVSLPKYVWKTPENTDDQKEVFNHVPKTV